MNIIDSGNKSMENDILRLEIIDEDSKYLEETMRLYQDSFPANERRPLMPLITDPKKEGVIFAVLNEDQYVGFIALLTHEKITHILYFATEESLRDKGFGKRILQLVKEAFPDHIIIADVEELDEESDNSEQRKKRIQFYLKNGYRQTDIEYDWRDEHYVIFVNGDYISRDDFENFWDYFYKQRQNFNY